MPEYKKKTEERINRMIDVLMKVAQGNYDVQVELTSQYDEFDSLAMGINMMINDIRKSFEIKSQNRKIKRENEVLEGALKQAEENERLKTAFLANMSHEIRTPLNSVLGFSEILRPNLAEEKFYQYREIILNSGRQLMQVIDDIMDVSKLESNQMIIFKEPCILKNVLEEQFELLSQDKRLLENSLLELKPPIIEKGYEYLVIETDPVRLGQILNNLINNAIKFTDEGYVEFGLLTDLQKGVIQFFVKDTGLGIHKDKLASIFDRFVQADNYRVKEGNGLGLSICKGLLDLLGGEIHVESQPGLGSIFYFTLPYVVPKVSERKKAEIIEALKLDK